MNKKWNKWKKTGLHEFLVDLFLNVSFTAQGTPRHLAGRQNHYFEKPLMKFLHYNTVLKFWNLNSLLYIFYGLFILRSDKPFYAEINFWPPAVP